MTRTTSLGPLSETTGPTTFTGRKSPGRLLLEGLLSSSLVLAEDCETLPPQAQVPRNHNDLNLALACIAELQPGQAVLSHIGHELDRWLLQHGQQLPAGVIDGRDGLQI